MKGSLPILTVAIALCGASSGWAQDPTRPTPPAASPAPNPSPGAEDEKSLLERSIDSLESYQSVTAKLRQRIDLFDQQLVGSGSYQQGPAADHTFRLELRTQVGERVSTLQHVSDGKTLWIYRQLFDEGKLSKVDLRRVSAALSKRAGVTPGVGASQWLGLGGLPMLLRSLNEHFQFDEPAEDQLGKLPVWRLTGSWQPKYLARFLPDQKAAIEAQEPVDLSKLRPEIPDEVVLYLGRDDLFPYRLDYLRQKEGLTSAALRGASGAEPLVTLEVFEVRVNAPLEASSFNYQPAAQPVPDVTQEYLRALGL